MSEMELPIPNLVRPYTKTYDKETEYIFACEFEGLCPPTPRPILFQDYELVIDGNTYDRPLHVRAEIQPGNTPDGIYHESIRIQEEPPRYNSIKQYHEARLEAKRDKMPFFDDLGGSDEAPREGFTRYLIWFGSSGVGNLWLLNGVKHEFEVRPKGPPYWKMESR